MNIHSKTLIKLLLAIPVALGAVAYIVSPTPTSAQSVAATRVQRAEQELDSIRKAKLHMSDYLNELAKAVKEEKRNDTWATKKESGLRTTYAAERSLPSGALKSVECRSTRCALQLQVGAEQSPERMVEQQAAVSRWISMTQPCGYTVTDAIATPGSRGVIRVFLDCR